VFRAHKSKNLVQEHLTSDLPLCRSSFKPYSFLNDFDTLLILVGRHERIPSAVNNRDWALSDDDFNRVVMKVRGVRAP
jgi:hypothetical protein